MWRWLWILILALSVPLPCGAKTRASKSKPAATAPSTESPPPATSQGPVSSEEAEVLWKDGRSAFDDGRYEDAIPLLQRLIDRYPGYTGYLDAHLLLGRSALEAGKPAIALKPLRYYTEAAKGEAAIDGKMSLGRAYLDLHRYQEALLLAEEVEKIKPPVNTIDQSRTLLLKTRALIGLGEEARAKQSLDSAKKLSASSEITKIAADVAGLELEIKTRDCAKLPSKGPLEEGQVRDQLDRRGSCLLEALVPLKNAFKTGEPFISERAEKQAGEAFEKYTQACDHPPNPPKTHPQHRTAQELSRYRHELTMLLSQECRKKVRGAVDILSGWKDEIPGTAEQSLDHLTHQLQKIASAPTPTQSGGSP